MALVKKWAAMLMVTGLLITGPVLISGCTDSKPATTTKVDTKAETKADTKVETKADTKADTKATTKTETK